ncbi:putative L-ascorbate peroxidase 6 isoform X2 [Cynara cardunculus var. scolymus]|uniref:putative L-ascorbate peroxidase 6 isoform X2 n=1 Tax=Cynara cardunculus var. scolymus TaxID=59895 RepID=UPI000D62A8F3|nr:putative L-ascorbate peroxidase 6 isoform X2 [Cynara cardunculus var. scolymus]
MSITGFDLSLRNLCSPNIPQFALRFKFPAQVRRKTDYGCNCTCTAVRPALCSTSSSSSTAVSDSRDADENHVPTSYGRRMMISVFGFLFPLHGSMQSSGANAADDLLLLQGEIRKVLSKGKAAGVLRLVFHDAGTYEMDEDSGGMNGSISFELDRPENKGLKKSLKILVEAKKIVDETQPVSLADMIAVAGAEAVSLCGGPKIPVQLGRLDSMVPDPEGKLPEETLDAFGLKHSFQRKGFSTQELVALSGAHTLGSKGFGNPVIFDNAYYKVLLEKPWLSSGMTSMIGLPSDRALIEDDECLRWISKYGDDQDLFFEDFKNAYIKLVNSGAKWRRNS